MPPGLRPRRLSLRSISSFSSSLVSGRGAGGRPDADLAGAEHRLRHFGDDRDHVEPVVGKEVRRRRRVATVWIAGGEPAESTRGGSRRIRLVLIVPIRDDLEELPKVEEERVLRVADEDFD